MASQRRPRGFAPRFGFDGRVPLPQPEGIGMSPRVALRWKLLILIGLAVTVVDQWTKFLAVKHLTPGIAMAHPDAKPVMTREARAELLDQMSLSEQLGAFYGSSRDPCRRPGVRCPPVEVVSGFWNWRYVQNPGAAWGLLANASEELRVPFFWVVSLAAIAFIIAFFRKLKDDQMLLIVSLSLVFGARSATSSTDCTSIT